MRRSNNEKNECSNHRVNFARGSIFFIFSRQLTNNPNEKDKQIDNLMKGEDFKMVEVFQKNKESFELEKNFFIENQIVENVAFFDNSNSMEVRTENEVIKMIN